MGRAQLERQWREEAVAVVGPVAVGALNARGLVVVPAWVIERLGESGVLERDHTMATVAGERVVVVNGVRIVSTPGTLGGDWRVDGTRISVDVIRRLRADGLKPVEIMRRFPKLTQTDILAALAFAAREPGA